MLARGVATTAPLRYGPIAGVVDSAAVFAVVHGLNAVAVTAFVVGLIAAEPRRSGSSWPGVLVHVVDNTISSVIAFVLTARTRRDPGGARGQATAVNSAEDSTHVLISGASVGGAALAYWSHRYGVRTTVVERSAKPRSGGQPVDIRGTAMRVLDQMGIIGELRTHATNSGAGTVVDADGNPVGIMPKEVFAGDLEVPRSDLTRPVRPDQEGHRLCVR